MNVRLRATVLASQKSNRKLGAQIQWNSIVIPRNNIVEVLFSLCVRARFCVFVCVYNVVMLSV